MHHLLDGRNAMNNLKADTYLILFWLYFLKLWKQFEDDVLVRPLEDHPSIRQHNSGETF